MGRKKISTIRAVRAANHPIRMAIVAKLADGTAMSPNELVEVCGASLGTVAYHVRTLQIAGIIELAEERRVRGAVEHFYALREEAREPALKEILRFETAARRAALALDPAP
jgi:DNA-binding transcriptional ArsR family regulator